MFTGIVEEVGTVVDLQTVGDSARLVVSGPLVTSDARHGDSIAVDGCCLTVTDLDGDTFGVDVMAESLAHTALRRLGPGSRVNLERAVAAHGRLGGHIVQGHVDGTGAVATITPSEHWTVVRVELAADLARYVAWKGSITLNGVSLTVSAIDDGPPAALEVSLIPTTLAATNLGELAVGDPVNVEVDVLAKYTERLLAVRNGVGPRS